MDISFEQEREASLTPLPVDEDESQSQEIELPTAEEKMDDSQIELTQQTQQTEFDSDIEADDGNIVNRDVFEEPNIERLYARSIVEYKGGYKFLTKKRITALSADMKQTLTELEDFWNKQFSLWPNIDQIILKYASYNKDPTNVKRFKLWEDVSREMKLLRDSANHFEELFTIATRTKDLGKAKKDLYADVKT